MIALLFVGGFSFVLALVTILSCIDWINRSFTKRQMRGEEPMNYFQQRVYGDRTTEDATQAKPRAHRTKKTARVKP